MTVVGVANNYWCVSRPRRSAMFIAPLLLTVEFVLALLLAVYLLYRYANIRRQNPFATVTTLVVWFLSFVIIFLLPVDVSSVSNS